MLLKRVLAVLCLAAMATGAAACGDMGLGNRAAREPAVQPQVDVLDDSNPNVGAGNVGQGTSGNTVVEATPMSQQELEAQPPGSSDPSGGAGGGVPPPNQGEPQQNGPMLTYTDDAYKFSV